MGAQTILDRFDDLYGTLHRGSELSVAKRQWTAAPDNPAERRHLADALTLFRRGSNLPAENSPSYSLISPSQDSDEDWHPSVEAALLADLLRLSDDTDPIDWLQCHHRRLVALLALQCLLLKVVPLENLLHSIEIISPIRLVRPKIKVQSMNSVHLKVEDIAIYEEGFVIHAKIRYGTSEKHSSLDRRFDYFGLGPISITDGDGHHYASWIVARKGGSIFRWYRGRFSLACWPALRDTHELVIKAPEGHLRMSLT